MKIIHNTERLAMDSEREYDKNGHLHIMRTHILKEGVYPYYGREIPYSEELGLDLNKVYYLYRPWDEIEKNASTLSRLPILGKHVPINPETIPTENIVGSHGSNVVAERPYLDCDVCFWTAEAIAGIETKSVQELSCAYWYLPVMNEGEFEGQKYDGSMTDIVYNHSAQVEASRNGSDMIAADTKPEIPSMLMTKFGKGMFFTLGKAFPKLAQDTKLQDACSKLKRKTFDAKAFKATVMAMDAEIGDPEVEDVIGALVNTDDPEAAVVAPVDKKTQLMQMLAGKLSDEELSAVLGIACDEEAPPAKPEGGADKPGLIDKPAMDAAIAVAVTAATTRINEANEARNLVRPVVGDVDMAMDSAEDIMSFALDHMKVNHKGAAGFSAKKAVFEVAQSKNAAATSPDATIAMDAANDVAKRFPALSRFKKG